MAYILQIFPEFNVQETPTMYKTAKIRAAVSLICLAGIAACSSESNEDVTMTPGTVPDPAASLAADLATAEGMIDAFYSFDPEKLRPFLSKAGDSSAAILGYQAWAEGGHYTVLARTPCAPDEGGTVVCPVTVRDDAVQALQTGFDVTDVFHLTFEDGVIVNVDTGSNDQPIYRDARVWVAENMPEVMEGPCLRDANGIRLTAGDCARAMTAGYAKYKAYLDELKAKAAMDDAFIIAEFEPPTEIGGWGFKLVPLGPDLVDIDYAAYMSSIEHLQATFSRNGNWPREGITAEEAMQDMLNEQGRFERRESFAYAVLSPEGDRELGCVYIKPSDKPGFDAEVTLWVTQAEYDAGFDATLFEWTKYWVEQSWPFTNVAYPGRDIAWADWDQL